MQELDKIDEEILASAEAALLAVLEKKEKLVQLAKKISRGYHLEWKAINDSLPYRERGKLCVRVRQNKGSIAIEWQTFWYSGPRGERIRNAKEITKGKTHRQNIGNLYAKRVKDWEIELFKEYEPEFAQIRQRYGWLAKASGTLKTNLINRLNGELKDFRYEEKEVVVSADPLGEEGENAESQV